MLFDTLVCNLPFSILVAHNNQTRVGVLGDVRGFLAVAINLNHGACGRPSSPVEDQPALYFAAGRAFKYMMLIADHHHGVVSNYLHQTHLSAARYTTHRAYSLRHGRFMWHYEDVVKGTRPGLSTSMCGCNVGKSVVVSGGPHPQAWAAVGKPGRRTRASQ
jgi:hypothetical protein